VAFVRRISAKVRKRLKRTMSQSRIELISSIVSRSFLLSM
jgi:hypothetical protein